MTAPRRGGFNSTALALVPLAIAMNIAVGQLVTVLKIPVYLDSIGTVLVGALIGPWAGLVTGVLSNILWTFPLGNPFAIYFAYVAGVIGLLAGFAGRAGVFQRQSPRWLSALVGGIFMFALALFVVTFVNATPDPNDPSFLIFPSAGDLIAQQPGIFLVAFLVGLVGGYFILQRAGYAGIAGLLTGVVAAVLSAPMAAYQFGGVTGAGTDLLVAAFRASGAGILASTLAQGTVSDPFDKMTSFLIVWLIVQSLPSRLLARFPNARRERSVPVSRPVGTR